MENNEEELVRVKIVRGSYRSSVSMDYYLANLLKDRLGGEAAFKGWVQATADELERSWQEKADANAAGTRVRARSGLSRMIQREAIRRILEECTKGVACGGTDGG